jgi:DeoR/GlpR family transcriptional regulator of sugar metabolism
VRNHSLALVGPKAIKTLEAFHADRAFLGSSGITVSHGHSTPNPLDAEVKQAMMRSADETDFLADSTKFAHACLATFANLSEIHLTITESRNASGVRGGVQKARCRMSDHELSPGVAESRTPC